MESRNAKIVGKRWDMCSTGYSGIVKGEMEGDLPKQWSEAILRHVPYKGKLKILDAGTGPGFFATILSLAGHDVTGIDCSAGMIEEAKANAEASGVCPKFEIMDNHSTSFADKSFDMIVSRNVTWTLYDPEKAFREWFRLLKPGGRLLYFDANWDKSILPESLRREIEEDKRLYLEKYGEPVNTYTGDTQTDEEFNSIVVLKKLMRPEWDESNLPLFGYERVKVIPRVNEELYPPSKQLLYRHVPLFVVTADRPCI